MGRLMEIALGESCNEAVARISRERHEPERYIPPAAELDDDDAPTAPKPAPKPATPAKTYRGYRPPVWAKQAGGGVIAMYRSGEVRFTGCRLSTARRAAIVKSLRSGDRNPHIPAASPAHQFVERRGI
jgi:hypothetical protein